MRRERKREQEREREIWSERKEREKINCMENK
jgi:hypothetical protein